MQLYLASAGIPDNNVAKLDKYAGGTGLWIRIAIILLLVGVVIHWLMRAFDFDVDQLLGYLFTSLLLVFGSVLTALIIVAAVKLFRR